jgi:VIT1/CCC1 family predicted Fe2+/Mn2+ transporter
MVTEEFGLRIEYPSPLRAAVSTFAAFLLAGSVPLVPYFLAGILPPRMTFRVSALATGVTFILIGLAKGRVVKRPLLLSGLETFAIGAAAAALAYGVGIWFSGVAGR